MLSDEDTAISLSGIGKIYNIPKSGRNSLSGGMMILSEALFGKPLFNSRAMISFPALKPMDLRIKQGESVAIVGRNGSGKSTLLQLIAGTLKPSSGEMEINGRISALLQLGSGFNPEFTGIENIYLNAAILGLKNQNIDEKLDDILAFADIGDFVKQPVKTYSTGMRLRLAFAVITAIDPEILIIDEALSVGDAFFQSRCVKWLDDYVSRGKTFLCVSHDMFMIKRLCKRGIVLDDGEKVFDADVAEAANLYYRLHRKKPVVNKPKRKGGSREIQGTEVDSPSDWVEVSLAPKERTGDGSITIEKLWTSLDLSKGVDVGSWVKFRFELEASESVDDFSVGCGFRDRSGQLIGGFHSFFTEHPYSIKKSEQSSIYEVEIKLELPPQFYLLTLGLAINHTVDDWYDIDCMWDCFGFELQGEVKYWGLAQMPYRNINHKRIAQ